VARRKLTLELDPIVRAVVAGRPPHEVDDVVLDATAELLAEHGLGRWSVDDVALRADVGRTSVYRRFPSRDDLVHEVLARELRRTIAAVGLAMAAADTLEDRVVEGVLEALAALDESIVDRLLRSDPTTMLPFLTTGAGPLVDLARRAFAPAILAAGVVVDPAGADLVAEALARLGLSFVLTRATSLPLEDPAALREAVRALVRPVIAA
jgi:AcrR family transcriptional regulator